MSTDELLSTLGYPFGTFIAAVISGWVPLVNIELVLLGVAALVPAHEIWVLPIAAGLGQMVAKATMYWGGRGVFRLSTEAHQARLEKWQHKFEQSEPGLSLFLFASAFAGLPPFFIVSILAGTCRVSFARFAVIGLAGRTLRFALVCAFPALARW